MLVERLNWQQAGWPLFYGEQWRVISRGILPGKMLTLDTCRSIFLPRLSTSHFCYSFGLIVFFYTIVSVPTVKYDRHVVHESPYEL